MPLPRPHHPGRPGRYRRDGPRGLCGGADDHLLTVHEEASAVQPVGPGAWPHTSGGAQGVRDPRTGRQAVDPGLAHLAADVDHDLGPGRRRRRALGRTLGSRVVVGRLVAPVGTVRRRLPYHLGRRHGLGAAGPEVLHGEDRRDDEQHRERGGAAPFHPAPRLQPHRHPLPQRMPGAFPPGGRVDAHGPHGAQTVRWPHTAHGTDSATRGIGDVRGVDGDRSGLCPPAFARLPLLGGRTLPRLAPRAGTFAEDGLRAETEVVRGHATASVPCPAGRAGAAAGAGAGAGTGCAAVAKPAVGGRFAAGAAGRVRCT